MPSDLEVQKFQELVKIELGQTISFDTAKQWSQNFYELMLLIVSPQSQYYDRLLIDANENDLESDGK